MRKWLPKTGGATSNASSNAGGAFYSAKKWGGPLAPAPPPAPPSLTPLLTVSHFKFEPLLLAQLG
jgi:hypothetical protein